MTEREKAIEAIEKAILAIRWGRAENRLPAERIMAIHALDAALPLVLGKPSEAVMNASVCWNEHCVRAAFAARRRELAP